MSVFKILKCLFKAGIIKFNNIDKRQLRYFNNFIIKQIIFMRLYS